MASQPVHTIRIAPSTLQSIFERILIKNGFAEIPARVCADVFVNNSVDGVYSHGVTRFPKYVRNLKNGSLQPGQSPILKNGFGGLEQWDGQSGPGPVNAIFATDRAVSLASDHGIGCVALANTNHWLRGGTYGWRAARAGCVFIGWSNTIANMPAFGATDARLGNNPLVIAIPYGEEAIVIDMAMTQYSYGALEMYELRKEKLPVPGGYDMIGNLTTDPTSIRKSQRSLPIGYWKGSGLSLLLDLVGTILSGGLSVASITKQKGEHNLSQVFIAIKLSRLQNFQSIQSSVQQIIADFHESVPESEHISVRYPGEKIVHTRNENNVLGVPVIESVWQEILALDVI